MAIEIVALANGRLPSTQGSLYDVPQSKRAILRSIRLVNTDTVAITVNLYYKRSGGTERHIIPKNLSLAPGTALIDDSEVTMQAQDAIEGVASVTAKVDFVLSGIEREDV
jgi:hypothetical protein